MQGIRREPAPDLPYWLQLKQVPGIGNLLCKRLLDRFETPQAVFQAADEELTGVEGITRRVLKAVRNTADRDAVLREIDETYRRGFQILTMQDAAYPALLKEIPDPPPFLYVYGDLKASGSSTAGPCIAMVGSRNPTRYGVTTTRRLCREMAARNVTVVSGMARGIDTSAHQGTLDGGGRTVAVLGSGLGRVYPAENLNLFHRIAESGAVITEFPLLSGPEPHHFPIRNRIISGMSLGVVVVEAAKKSGSLITARLAAEQNREVFAVPGNIHSFKSVGTHSLIKQGAKLVENADDIMEELSPVIRFQMGQSEHPPAEMLPGSLPPLSPDELRVYNALGPYSVHIDDLVRKLEMDAGELSGVLLQLELKGAVTQSPGKMFCIDVEGMIGRG